MTISAVTDAKIEALRQELRTQGTREAQINSIIAQVRAGELDVDKLIRGAQFERTNSNDEVVTTNTTFNAKEAGFTEEQINYLIKENIISRNGDVCTFLNGQSVETLQRTLQKQKTEAFLQENQNVIKEEPAVDADENFAFNVTTTEEIENDFGAPSDETMRKADLENRSERKKYEEQYKSALQNWLGSNEKNEEIMNSSLLAKKYDKQVNKAKRKFMKEYRNNEVGLVNDFFDGKIEGAKPTKSQSAAFFAKRSAIEQALIAVRDGNATEEQKKIADEVKQFSLKANTANIENIVSDPKMLEYHATKYAIEAMKKGKFDIVNNIADQAAKHQVLSKRSKSQIKRDKEYFLDYMSEREVQNHRDANRMENTQIHFSKQERKAAEKAESNEKAIHTDIGKYGRKMVKSRPDLFCTVDEKGLSAEEQGLKPEELEEQGIFVRDGKVYRFDSQKFSEKIGEFIDNKQTADDAGNTHATLEEVRDMAGRRDAQGHVHNQIFFDESDKPVTLEGLYGNGNGHVGYWEGRRTRNIVKSTGRSVDKDRTNWMVAEAIAEKSALSFALGFIPGALGAKGAQAVAEAGSTVVGVSKQIVEIEGHTFEVPDAVYNDMVSTTDTTTTIIDGEVFTNSTTHNTPVSGTASVEYVINARTGEQILVVDGKFSYGGKTIEVGAKEIIVDGKPVTLNPDGTVTIDGKRQIASTKPDWLKQGLRTGLYSMLLALPMNVKQSLGIEDLGDTQDVVNLHTKKRVPKTSQEEVNLRGTQLSHNIQYDGWAADKGVLNRNKVEDYSKATQLGTNGNVRAQAVYASENMSIVPAKNNGILDFKKPAEITLKDKTNNGKVHTFVYQLVTPEEAQAFGLSDVQKPLYKLVSVIDENGKNIRNANSPDEVYRLDLEELDSAGLTQDRETGFWTNTLNYKYNLMQDDARYPGYDRTSMDYKNHSNYLNRRH